MSGASKPVFNRAGLFALSGSLISSHGRGSSGSAASWSPVERGSRGYKDARKRTDKEASVTV